MFNFTGSAILYLFISLAIGGLIALLLSPRESLRGLAEFFSIRVFRNLWRSVLGDYRPRWLVCSVLLAAALLLLASLVFPQMGVVVSWSVYLFILVPLMLLLFFAEAFGRHRSARRHFHSEEVRPTEIPDDITAPNPFESTVSRPERP